LPNREEIGLALTNMSTGYNAAMKARVNIFISTIGLLFLSHFDTHI
jgi:hypothetical protein